MTSDHHSAQEDHADGKRLIRVRDRLRTSGYLEAPLTVSVLPLPAAAGLAVCSDPAGPPGALGTSGGLRALCLGPWWRGTRRAAQSLAVVGAMARKPGLVRRGPSAESGGEW